MHLLDRCAVNRRLCITQSREESLGAVLPCLAQRRAVDEPTYLWKGPVRMRTVVRVFMLVMGDDMIVDMLSAEITPL